DLELRLDHRHEVATGGEAGDERVENQAQRDERQVRDHLARAGAQQDVGESTRGGAGVQAAAAGHGEPGGGERGQRAGELAPAARDVVVGGLAAADDYRVGGVDH